MINATNVAAAKALPQRLNSALSLTIALAVLAQMFGLPWALAGHPYIMAAFILLLMPLNTPFWSLIHEAVHRNFHANININEWAGRLMSVLFGAAFDVLRFGHLMHHQYNREWESELFDPARHNKILFCANHYFKMLGGLYLTEVATSFLIAISPLPVAQRIAKASFSDLRHQQAVLNALLKPRIVARLRFDCALIVALYTLAFWVSVPVTLSIIAARAVIISLMDNAYHYGTPGDNSVIAHELKVPGPLAAFILNFNHHETHHRNTGLPWTQLRDSHNTMGLRYGPGLIHAMMAQFKGPIRAPAAPRDHTDA